MRKMNNDANIRMYANDANSRNSRAYSQYSHRLGQSVIEVVVAVSMFVIIAGSAVVTMLGSFLTSRLAEEETQAASMATEGIEAAQSIRNKDWRNLVDGNHGLSSTGDTWIFSGTSDEDGKFTRTVSISSVERDENDDIVISGVVVDPDTKKITSQVSWDFTSARTNTVEMVSYLSNWQETRRVASCLEYCKIRGFSAGTCRRNVQACSQNGEINKSDGDLYCTGGSQEDTCCCL